MNLQSLIAESVRLRDAAAECAKREKLLRAEKETIDEEIIALLDAAGTDQARSEIATVSVQTKQIPNITDWESFYAFVNLHKAPYLLQRRVAQGALEEMILLEGDIEGVSFHEKRELSIRKR